MVYLPPFVVHGTHAYELIEAGFDRVYRETLDTSLRISGDVMSELGIPAFEALRRVRRFRRHDEEALRELSGKREDTTVYMHLVRQQAAALEQVLSSDLEDMGTELDAAWDSTSLRDEAGADDAAS